MEYAALTNKDYGPIQMMMMMTMMIDDNDVNDNNRRSIMVNAGVILGY